MSTRYIKITEKEFDAIREEINSAHSAIGAMDDDASKDVLRAVRAMQAVEKRNGLEPLYS